MKMGFDHCSENEQYTVPLVKGLVEPAHYYGRLCYTVFLKCGRCSYLHVQVVSSVRRLPTKKKTSNFLLDFYVLCLEKLTFMGHLIMKSLALSLLVRFVPEVRTGVSGPANRLGVLDLEDECGKKARLHPGEAFFIRRGSMIIFSTTRFAVVFKCSAYAAGLGKSKELIEQ
jgi:hypothetical protein